MLLKFVRTKLLSIFLVITSIDYKKMYVSQLCEFQNNKKKFYRRMSNIFLFLQLILFGVQ